VVPVARLARRAGPVDANPSEYYIGMFQQWFNTSCLLWYPQLFLLTH
jgi:hypothetical protein